LIIVLLLLLLPAVFVTWTLTGGHPQGQWVRVTHVIDGDTIGVGRGWRYQQMRLIGVDTPETVHPEKPVEVFGLEAAAFTTRQLQSQWVHLEFEVGNLRDRYDRLLAYVFLADGTLFNAELIKHGYARVIAPVPFRYYEEFKRYEHEARQADVGRWHRKGTPLQKGHARWCLGLRGAASPVRSGACTAGDHGTILGHSAGARTFPRGPPRRRAAVSVGGAAAQRPSPGASGRPLAPLPACGSPAAPDGRSTPPSAQHSRAHSRVWHGAVGAASRPVSSVTRPARS
jgi:micrococcal nuclease